MSFEIAIAGVGFRFECRDGHGQRELALRYRRFAVSVTEKAFPIALTGGVGSAPQLGEPVVIRSGARGEVELEVGGNSATLDFAKGAEIRAAQPGTILDAVVRLVLGERLAARGGLLVHASAVRLGAGVHVFVGPSGAGKSTLARTLDATPLCDEAVALAPGPLGVEAHATPYWNGQPGGGPLASLSFIERGAAPAELELGSAAAAAKLCAASGPWAPGREELALGLAAGVARRARARRLVLSSIEDIRTWLQPRLEHREAA